MTTIEDAGLFALARTGEAEEIIGAVNDRIYSGSTAEPSVPAKPPLDPSTVNTARATIWGLLSTISMAASAYHGYKRNESVGWALGWGFLGAMFPVITPVVAVAQGYAEPGPDLPWKRAYETHAG